MDDRSRQQRADDWAADLRNIPSEEMDRMGSVMSRRSFESLGLQALLLVVGVRTGRRVYEARRLGWRPLVRIAANGPLVGLSILTVGHWILTVRWLARWSKRVRTTPTG